jgi:hypothetical protein
MISQLDGEVSFSDGLVVRPHMPSSDLLTSSSTLIGASELGWMAFRLGEHPSEYGNFLVEVACATEEDPVFLVVLVSTDPFFATPVEGDRERWIFHEGVLARELCGQREFAWGEAFCKYDRQDRRNCLNVVYVAGPKVPNSARGARPYLVERSFPEIS